MIVYFKSEKVEELEFEMFSFDCLEEFLDAVKEAFPDGDYKVSDFDDTFGIEIDSDQSLEEIWQIWEALEDFERELDTQTIEVLAETGLLNKFDLLNGNVPESLAIWFGTTKREALLYFVDDNPDWAISENMIGSIGASNVFESLGAPYNVGSTSNGYYIMVGE